MPLDAAQLARLIESQTASLQLWVGSRCSSPEDVVQEAFCRLAWQEPAPDQPVAWLYAVCRNLAEKQRLSETRRRKREQARAAPEVTSSRGTEALEWNEILAAIDTLDSDLREILVARVWGQLSLEEVGKLCGLSTATAYRRYESALKALRQKLT